MAWRKSERLVSAVARAAMGAVLMTSVLILADEPAFARHQHHRRIDHSGKQSAFVPSTPTFSALVIDANSGRTLYAVDPNGLRHPASITKVMTLYLLFEQLDKGAMTLQSRLPISEHAAAQEPSKLGLEPGDTISVDDAIKAVVTRSANDIAVAIAEAIGHDENTFAELMTRKARALGMANTTYRNASGLPNDRQITTARDLTVLARSLEDRFPRYSKYFATEEFDYDGETIGNHNHLLGRIDGVDGIKTGYTRASGFNLLTSVHRDGRSILAVVMGGRTAASRDQVMANLIEDHIAQGSTVRTATRIADASEERSASAPQVVARPQPVVVAASVPRLPAARPAPALDGEGDRAGDDEQPTLRVMALQAGAQPPSVEVAPTPPRTIAEDPVAIKPIVGAASSKAVPADRQKSVGLAAVAPPSRPKFDARVRPEAKAPLETTVASRSANASIGDPVRGEKGWKIQIGATEDAAKAAALLDKARKHDRPLLSAAKPITEKIRKGDVAYYRAQFAGLDSESAESACRSLKRSGFSCFPTRD